MRKAHLLLFCAAAAWAAPALAQSDNDQIRAEIAELKNRLAALEARLNAPTAVVVAPDQPPPPAIAEQADTGLPEAKLQPATIAPNVMFAPLDQPVQNPNLRAAFQLTASTTAKRAELLFSNTISKPSFAASGEGEGKFETYTLSASAPLAEQGVTNIGTLSGFDDGFAVKMRYTSFQAKLRRPPARVVRDAAALAKRNCLAKEAASPNREATCAADPDTAFLRRYLTPGDYDTYQASFFGKSSFAWGFEGGVGYSTYKFLDPVTAADGKATRWPISAKIFGSYFPQNSNSDDALIGSFAYERSYKAAKTKALCPAATLPVTTCPVGPVGKPNLTDKYLLAVGERSYVKLDDFVISAFAIAQTITYDFNSDALGFDLPIYLVPDKDGNLTGGVRIGYNTSDDEVGICLFVGSAFWLGQ